MGTECMSPVNVARIFRLAFALFVCACTMVVALPSVQGRSAIMTSFKQRIHSNCLLAITHAMLCKFVYLEVLCTLLSVISV